MIVFGFFMLCTTFEHSTCYAFRLQQPYHGCLGLLYMGCFLKNQNYATSQTFSICIPLNKLCQKNQCLLKLYSYFSKTYNVYCTLFSTRFSFTMISHNVTKSDSITWETACFARGPTTSVLIVTTREPFSLIKPINFYKVKVLGI